MVDYSTVGLSTLCSVVLVFVFRNWISERIKKSIQYEYDQKLETHRAKVQGDYNVQIERLRADLAQRQFQSSRMYDKTAESIEHIYAGLLEFKRSAIKFSHITNPDQDQANEFGHALMTFEKYYGKNKIYLPNATVELIDEAFHSLVQRGLAYPDKVARTEGLIKELLEKVRGDFQRVLGVAEQTKDHTTE